MAIFDIFFDITSFNTEMNSRNGFISPSAKDFSSKVCINCRGLWLYFLNLFKDVFLDYISDW